MNREQITQMGFEIFDRMGPDNHCREPYWTATDDELERFAALVAAAERERICKAIKAEDDHCVTEGDYMLDSDDCIAVAKGEWVRPDYSVDAIRARGNT